jgi:hypothetical protein
MGLASGWKVKRKERPVEGYFVESCNYRALPGVESARIVDSAVVFTGPRGSCAILLKETDHERPAQERVTALCG